MKLVCLTGGIACGKSTILNLLRDVHGFPTLEYDTIVRSILKTADPSQIGQMLQADVATNGRLDREKFLTALFADRDRKTAVERALAETVWSEVETHIAMHRHARILVIESAVVFEAGLENKFDAIITANCSDRTQLERLMRRESMTLEGAMLRIASQMPNREKAARADLVVNTDCSKAELVPVVAQLAYFLNKL